MLIMKNNYVAINCHIATFPAISNRAIPKRRSFTLAINVDHLITCSKTPPSSYQFSRIPELNINDQMDWQYLEIFLYPDCIILDEENGELIVGLNYLITLNKDPKSDTEMNNFI
jgi:hypothetical protein